VAIAAGYFYSLALKSDGTVWAWGYNYSGQLGNGTVNNNSNIPVQVLGSTGQGSVLSGIVAIAAGSYHSLAIKSDGTVWAWGDGSTGQFGNGTPYSSVPVSANIADAIDVKGGNNHTLALKSNSILLAWGNNGYGQLGNGTFVLSFFPVVVSGFSTPSYPCAAGTVNLGSGTPSDVLFVNGSAGNMSRIVNVGVNTPITVDIVAPPAGPNPAFGMLWAWLGYPTAPTALIAFGQTIGCTANPPSFMPALLPQPAATLMFYAPFMLASTSGLPTPIQITLQGIAIDFGSATPVPMSITNAVMLNVQ
jgi:hypothetical protein